MKQSMAERLMYESGQYGVKVLSWGSEMSPYISAALDHNPGHVALELNIPNNERTRRLVKSLEDTDIEIQDLGSRGYHIYFSVWPSSEEISAEDLPDNLRTTIPGKIIQYTESNRSKAAVSNIKGVGGRDGVVFSSMYSDWHDERPSAPVKSDLYLSLIHI